MFKVILFYFIFNVIFIINMAVLLLWLCGFNTVEHNAKVGLSSRHRDFSNAVVDAVLRSTAVQNVW